MALKVVQDTSTNWTPKEWRVIDRMKKAYAEMDERSGQPWKLGDDALILAPIGDPFVQTGRNEILRDAALEVGCSPNSLRFYTQVSAAWPDATRVASVGYSVFRTLAYEDDRVAILKRLIAEFGAENITVDDARRVIGTEPTRPRGLKEYVSDWSRRLEPFMNQRLYSADRLALEQLRLKIDILLGDAEEATG